MGRQSIRYREIADSLRDRIRQGIVAPGDVLPSEATLSAEYASSRVTVRRALEILRDEGLVSSRQGAGWFVSIAPLRQSLGRLGTIEAQLEASQRSSTREVTAFAFTTAPAWVADALGSDDVLEVRRRNLADGLPFARITVWCPADIGRHLSRARIEATSFYDALGTPLGSATQTIGAAAAAPDDAEILGIPHDSPVLVCRRITRGLDGRALLASEHVFPSHLTEFVVELTDVAESIAPSGLRLVEER